MDDTVNVMPIAGTIAEAAAADQNAILPPYRSPHTTPALTPAFVAPAAIFLRGAGMRFFVPIKAFPRRPLPRRPVTALS